MNFYEQRFVGIMPAEIVVDAPNGFDAEERDRAGDVRAALEEQEPGVARTLSIADLYADGCRAAAIGVLRASGRAAGRAARADGRRARVLVFRGDLGTAAWQRFAAAVERSSAEASTRSSRGWPGCRWSARRRCCR